MKTVSVYCLKTRIIELGNIMPPVIIAHSCILDGKHVEWETVEFWIQFVVSYVLVWVSNRGVCQVISGFQ